MKKSISAFVAITVLLLSITIYSQLPPPPVYLGLSDSNSTTPKLLWSKVPTATSYGLQIATDSFCQNIIIDASGIIDTFYQLQQGLPGLNLYLHLRSINANGNGPWSICYLVHLYFQGGIIKISNTIPDKFSLFQNYPNPFNPTTKIKFDIPLSRGVPRFPSGRGVSVKLTIYDLLGCEVAVLVNEQLKPGTYEIEFDGTNYPSGVYFYKLTTNDFSETKKMVLKK
jgi:hypothetical protein